MIKKTMGVVVIIFIGIFAAPKFNQAQTKNADRANDKIARIVVLKAFDAMTKQANNDKSDYIDCLGTPSKTVKCHALGNISHEATFMTEREMPLLVIRGLRNIKKEELIPELRGFPDKLDQSGINELITIFDKPISR